MAFDATDLLDRGATFTSNVAALIRGVIDAAEAGIEVNLEALRPAAQQLDEFLGNEDAPLPTVPSGGVPIDAPVASDAEVAATVGATAP